jgi:hypothetical protein
MNHDDIRNRDLRIAHILDITGCVICMASFFIFLWRIL